MSRHCYVSGCSNGDYKLITWPKKSCLVHVGINHSTCGCNPPFVLHTFPSEKKNPDKRFLWRQLINRSSGKKKDSFWSPGSQSRVCSDHFVDGKPTIENPYPTENLGYMNYEKRVKNLIGKRRKTVRCKDILSQEKMTDKINIEHLDVRYDDLSVDDSDSTQCDESDSYILSMVSNTVCYVFLNISIIVKLVQMLCRKTNKEVQVSEVSDKDLLVKYLLVKNKTLENKIKQYELQISECTCRMKITEKLLKNDQYTKFFTGVERKSLFYKLHDYISQFVQRKWRGTKNTTSQIVRKFKSTPKKTGPSSKLSSQEEFLMMLMKLRLGLLNEDLSKRFNVSAALVSQVFSTWLRASAKVLKNFIYVPEMGILNACRPKRFLGQTNLHSIIDATETFIQTPKSHDLQRMTWSNYKHHNTVKILVAVASNSQIIYVSNAYTGSISDKELVRKCQYLEMVEPYSNILVDKGFNISDECDARRIMIKIPPGKRGQSQMMASEIKKTNEIAKLRILVE